MAIALIVAGTALGVLGVLALVYPVPARVTTGAAFLFAGLLLAGLGALLHRIGGKR